MVREQITGLRELDRGLNQHQIGKEKWVGRDETKMRGKGQNQLLPIYCYTYSTLQKNSQPLIIFTFCHATDRYSTVMC